MTCAILFCLAGLYLEGGVGIFDHPPDPPAWAQAKYNGNAIWKYDANHTANPRGRIAVGHEWEPSPKWRINLELRHESWIGTTADYGQNSVWVSGRVYPWK